jgi:hypothetical protein
VETPLAKVRAPFNSVVTLLKKATASAETMTRNPRTMTRATPDLEDE